MKEAENPADNSILNDQVLRLSEKVFFEFFLIADDWSRHNLARLSHFASFYEWQSISSSMKNKRLFEKFKSVDSLSVNITSHRPQVSIVEDF